MAIPLDQPKITESQSRSAAEIGLASLILGGLLAVMAILVLQINLQMFLSPRAWASNDVQAIRYAAVAGAIVMGGLTITSMAFGIRSIATANNHAQTNALGWAGLLISTLALLLWIGTLVDLFFVLDMLLRRTPAGVLDLDSLKRAMPGLNFQ